MLTRYACYLIAPNGDPKKEEVVITQGYFAVRTRKAELIEERLNEIAHQSTRMIRGRFSVHILPSKGVVI